MKRISILTCVLLAIGSLSFFATAQEKQVPKTDKPLVVEPVVKSKPVSAVGRRELTFRQRRELGLTVANLVEVARELKTEGEIERGTPNGEIAASIAVRLIQKNPEGFKDSEALDLDSIIAFIERLLPLILKLIDLFS